MISPATSQSLSSADKEALDVVGARTQAWWVQLLAAELAQPHPVYGSEVSFKLDGGVLTVKGRLPSPADVDKLLSEADQFKDHGISEVRSELEVAETADRAGLLVQTLISAFENREGANLAATWLKGHMNVNTGDVAILEPGQSAREVLPEQFAQEADGALSESKTVLIVTLDETAAFTARQLLEEETRSLWTVALPPQPATAVEKA